jgi:beta-lactamase class D
MWRSLSLSILLGLGSVQITQAQTPKVEAPKQVDFQRHFQALKVEGSILIYDQNNDRTYEHNPVRNRTAFSPASTFKILNSLIALETNVIQNELSILTWDGIDRAGPGWNQDLNLQEAYKRSAVWFYQILARRVGHETMTRWVQKAQYGNQKIGGKGAIDSFWLTGDLRITPQEQVAFLQRLQQEKLPFSKRSIAMVKNIMILEQTPQYTMRAKTGWSNYGEANLPQQGWLVGYVEQNKNTYFFATHIDIREPLDAKARMVITRSCLKDLGLL